MKTTNTRRARTELRRAYLLLQWGHLEEALESCDLAEALAPDHPLPATLAGSFLASFGHHLEGLRRLKRVTRTHPDFALAHLFIAETSFLLDRKLVAMRSLERAREASDYVSYQEFGRRLEVLLEEPVGLPPLVVPWEPLQESR